MAVKGQGFTPRRVAQYEETVERLCASILDAVCEDGACDFVVDVSGSLAPLDVSAPALAMDPPAAATNDATPELHGAAGTALAELYVLP